MTQEKLTNETVRLNLSLSKEFYDLLQQNAKNEYVQVGTWTKSYLMKNLLEGDKEEKCLTQNGNN